MIWDGEVNVQDGQHIHMIIETIGPEAYFLFSHIQKVADGEFHLGTSKDHITALLKLGVLERNPRWMPIGRNFQLTEKGKQLYNKYLLLA